MANPVTPVRPVDPVSAVRAVNSGITYFRHLEQWRIYSEFYASQPRAKARRAERIAAAGALPVLDKY